MTGGDGRILETWLQQIADGEAISGTTRTVTSRDGQVTETGASKRYRIGMGLGSGGQAAVVAVRTDGQKSAEEQLVARVEFYPRDEREMQRRKVLLFLAHLSRTQPDHYPALIRVRESFLVSVPVTQLPGHVAGPQVESAWVWVDIMERCTPLRDQMASLPNGHAPVDGVRLVAPLLDTVGTLYEDHKLIHRDIDEGNALIAADGTLRLADWGIAHPMSGDHTHTHTAPFGKWATTPPEIREGAWAISHYTDAWQCGRLTGYVFIGASPLLNDGIEANHPRLHDLPSEVRSVIEGLCHPDPNQRLTTPTAAGRLDVFRRDLEEQERIRAQRDREQKEKEAEEAAQRQQEAQAVTQQVSSVALSAERKNPENGMISAAAFLLAGAGLVFGGAVAAEWVTLEPGENFPPELRIESEKAEEVRSDLRRKLRWPYPISATVSEPAILWRAGKPTLELNVESITNPSGTPLTFSWDCERWPEDENLRMEDVSSIYLIVDGPYENQDHLHQPVSWGVGDGDYDEKSYYYWPAACGIKDENGNEQPLDTYWPTITIEPGTTWADPGSNHLVFGLPQGELLPGATEYPREIFGLVLVSEEGQFVVAPVYVGW